MGKRKELSRKKPTEISATQDGGNDGPKQRRKADALAMAELIYDIYKEEIQRTR